MHERAKSASENPHEHPQTNIELLDTAPMVKFSYTILYVQDVTKSIEFYESGLGLKRKFITP
ncbi:MAG: hypothetical protein K2Q22_14775, partial [Cytophagales bacterium]|nr:hypothetical protein [Cytophagales bacterium]